MGPAARVFNLSLITLGKLILLFQNISIRGLWEWWVSSHTANLPFILNPAIIWSILVLIELSLVASYWETQCIWCSTTLGKRPKSVFAVPNFSTFMLRFCMSGKLNECILLVMKIMIKFWSQIIDVATDASRIFPYSQPWQFSNG